MSLYGSVVLTTEEAVLSVTRQAQDLGVSAVGAMTSAARTRGDLSAQDARDDFAARSVQLGDAWLDVLIPAQDVTISAVAQLKAATSALVPDLSKVPLGSWLLTADELVESTLGFAGSLLELQRGYCARLRDELVEGPTEAKRRAPDGT